MKRAIGPKQRISLTGREIEKLRRDAINTTMQIMRVMPMLALRDEFGFGKVRMERYIEKLDSIVQAYNEDRISIRDVAKVLEDEIGVEVWDDEF